MKIKFSRTESVHAKYMFLIPHVICFYLQTNLKETILLLFAVFIFERIFSVEF